MTGGWRINLQGNAFLPACILMCSLENLPSHVYMQGVGSSDKPWCPRNLIPRSLGNV